MTAMTWWLSLAGLLAGFLGALFLTISQQPDRGIAEGRPHGREVYHLVLERPRLWTWGLWLLCGGFLLQLVSLVSSR